MNEAEIRSKIRAAVEDAREKNPMAPSVTNTVTQDFVANAQLAVGGSAAMLYLPDECEAIAAIAPAVYINMGTALPFYAETLPRMIRALADCKTPWVLDPVGIGMSSLRTELIRQMKHFPPTIVRGNASEIIAVARLWGLIDDETIGRVRGVDSTDSVASARDAAITLARYIKGAAAVSGSDDLITDGEIVESGTREHIFRNPRHPYTLGLFGSLPKLDDDSKRLSPIKGLPPDPTHLPEGCKFCPRCPHADKCSQAANVLMQPSVRKPA